MPERPHGYDGRKFAASFTIDTGRRKADQAPGTEATDNRPPIAMVFDALKRSARGENPYQKGQDSSSFRASLIHKLGLASPKRDGIGLADRFRNTDPDFDGVALFDNTNRLSDAVTAIISTAHQEHDLGAAVNPKVPRETIDLQRQVVRDLVAVAVTQFDREMPEATLRTKPPSAAEAGADVATSNAHVDPLTSELLMMTPDSILGEEFGGLRQRIFEHEFTSSVRRHAGAEQDARIVARAIQRELGFEVDETGEELPQARIFIQTGRNAVPELFNIKGVEEISSEERHKALATAMGAEAGSSLGDFLIQYESENEAHRLAPVAV